MCDDLLCLIPLVILFVLCVGIMAAAISGGTE